jgi:hypothetical protein
MLDLTGLALVLILACEGLGFRVRRKCDYDFVLSF